MAKSKGRICSACGRSVEDKRIFEIDDEHFCSTCLYGIREPFELFPIGYVRKQPLAGESLDGEVPVGDISCIELNPSQERFLYGIEEEKHITIVYYFHKSGPVKSVFRRGLDGKRKGVFATRTPHRLSKIGIQDVKLVRVEGTNLFVAGLDAVDGTPVLDIKLYWSHITP